MFILFFIVHLFFASLFYFLNARFEAIAFVVLGIGSLILFSPYKIFGKKKSSHTENSIKDTVGEVKSTISDTVTSFFSRQALFLSIITTDLALLGIIYGGKSIFGLSLSTFISSFVIFLTLCGILFIFLKYFQSHTVQQIVELHIPILGFLLLVGYFLPEHANSMYNSAFTGFLLFLGTLVLKGDCSMMRKMIYSLIFCVVFYLTSILWIIFFFGSIPVSKAFILLFLYSVGFFEGVSLTKFKEFREPIRAISLLGLYVSTIAFGILLFTNGSYWLVVYLLLSLAFNIYVHARFENYPSLVFSTLIPVPLYYFFFGISENFWSFLISSFLMTLGLTFFGRIIRTSYHGDEYVFQSVAILVLIGNTISFGWRVGIVGIFEYSILLLLFSIVTFISYLQTRK